MNNEAKQQKRAVGLELSFGGLRAQRAAHGNQPKEKTSPTAPIHSLSSTAQQLSLLWLWLEKPTKEKSWAVGLNESGAGMDCLWFGWLWAQQRQAKQAKEKTSPAHNTNSLSINQLHSIKFIEFIEFELN